MKRRSQRPEQLDQSRGLKFFGKIKVWRFCIWSVVPAPANTGEPLEWSGEVLQRRSLYIKPSGAENEVRLRVSPKSFCDRPMVPLPPGVSLYQSWTKDWR